MKLNPNRAREVIQEFLERWPIDRVRNMTLKEYVDVGNRDTFCYWVERGTIEAGNITGQPSTKFGIFKRKESADLPKTKRYQYDEKYTWGKAFGDTKTKAFNRIRKEIVSVIEAASRGDFEAINDSELNQLWKWKVATLYSQGKLVNIFSGPVLRSIAEGLGLATAKEAPISALQRYIMSQKLAEQDVYRYSHDLYLPYDREDSEEDDEEQEGPNYYIIGSKYG